MSLLLGLALGFGLLLIYQSFTPATARTRRKAPSRIDTLLLRAGLDKVTRAGFIYASVTSAIIVGLIVLVLTGAYMIALTFAGFGLCAPWAIVRRQAAKRSAALREQWPDVVDQQLLQVTNS